MSASVLPGYRADLLITDGNDITTKLFVKQRVKKYDQTLDNNFVAVSSSANLHDIAEDAPHEGSSYFRTDTISLVSSDLVLLNAVIVEIIDEIELLMQQEAVIDANSSLTSIYTISADGVGGVSPTQPLPEIGNGNPLGLQVFGWYPLG
jgi:hypothetical protein